MLVQDSMADVLQRYALQEEAQKLVDSFLATRTTDDEDFVGAV